MIWTSCLSLWHHFGSQFCHLGVTFGALWIHFLCKKTDWGTKDAPKGDVITICLIGKGGQIVPSLDQDVAAYLIDAMAALKFSGASGKTMLAYHKRTNYLLVGIGVTLNAGKAAENLGGQLFSALADTNAKRGWLSDHQLDDTVLADICFGAELASYHFDKYFTDNKSDDLQVQLVVGRH